MIERLNIANFLKALESYIRECRVDSNRVKLSQRTQFKIEVIEHIQIETNSFWVVDCMINMHASIFYWKRANKSVETKALNHKFVRCSHVWRERHDTMRQDWVWVQNFNSTAQKQMKDKDKKIRAKSYVEDLLINQLIVVITIVNSDSNRYNAKSNSLRYQNALIDTF